MGHILLKILTVWLLYTSVDEDRRSYGQPVISCSSRSLGCLTEQSRAPIESHGREKLMDFTPVPLYPHAAHCWYVMLFYP